MNISIWTMSEYLNQMDIDVGSTMVHYLLFALSEAFVHSALGHCLLSEARLDDLDSDICEASHLVRNV